MGHSTECRITEESYNSLIYSLLLYMWVALGPSGKGISPLQKQHLPQWSSAEKKLERSLLFVVLMGPPSQRFCWFWRQSSLPCLCYPCRHAEGFSIILHLPAVSGSPCSWITGWAGDDMEFLCLRVKPFKKFVTQRVITFCMLKTLRYSETKRAGSPWENRRL